jgi:hypothetical protein
VALDLTNADVRSSLTLAAGVRVEGTLALSGAHVRGGLALRGTSWRSPSDESLIEAQSTTVDGDADLCDILAAGGRLLFRGSVFGGGLDAEGAWLDNPAGSTLSLHHTVVRGSVRLDKVVSTGVVSVNRCTIEGQLRFAGATLVCPEAGEGNADRHAVQARDTTVRSGVTLDWARVTPSVDFSDLRTTALADDPATWPPTFLISGLTYDTFTGTDPWRWRPRADWLAKQTVFDPAPYEQAAKVFRQHGYANDAAEILVAQQNHLARTVANGLEPKPSSANDVVRLARHIGHLVFGWSSGYGYRPGRVLWLMTAVLVAVLVSVAVPAGRDSLRATDVVGTVYTTVGPVAAADAAVDVCGGGRVRCLNPVFYAIDTVVPLVSLGQRSTWYPDARAPGGLAMDIWLNIATLLGWLLSGMFVLSLTRAVRSN